MSRVGIRELKQNASAVVARAAAGESVTITDRGRPVARLVPLSGDVLGDLVAGGRARPAKRAWAEVPPPARPTARRRSVTAALDEQRSSERY